MHIMVAEPLLWHLLKFYEIKKPHQKYIQYKLIMNPTIESKTPAKRHWEGIINHSYSAQQWRQTLQRPQRISRCTLHWESVQKILNDWYLTPTKDLPHYISYLPHA